MQIHPKDRTELKWARTRFDNPIKVYDDCWGPLWLYGQEYGPTMIIRAQDWHSAYEIAIDESPTVPVEELHEAYGFETREEMEKADKLAQGGLAEWPDLQEGYQYQSNASGTGVVFSGYYEWLEPFTSEYLKREEIRIRIAAQ